MKITRRKFLETVPIAVGVAMTARGVVSGQRMGSVPVGGVIGSGDTLSRLTWDSFYPYVNTDFTFTGNGSKSVSLRLTNMTDTKPADLKLRPGQECFVLTFTGLAARPLTQDKYSIDHFALGGFELFITTAGKTGRSQRYDAVVNRIVL